MCRYCEKLKNGTKDSPKYSSLNSIKIGTIGDQDINFHLYLESEGAGYEVIAFFEGLFEKPVTVSTDILYCPKCGKKLIEKAAYLDYKTTRMANGVEKVLNDTGIYMDAYLYRKVYAKVREDVDISLTGGIVQPDKKVIAMVSHLRGLLEEDGISLNHSVVERLNVEMSEHMEDLLLAEE